MKYRRFLALAILASTMAITVSTQSYARDDWWRSSFGAGGATLLGSNSKEECLWNVTTGQVLRRFPTNMIGFVPVVSSNGDILATGKCAEGQLPNRSPGEAVVWSVSSGKPLRRFTGLNGWTLALSPDSKTLATAGEDSPVVLCDIGTGKMRRLGSYVDMAWRSGFSNFKVFGLAFSTDGKTLACGGAAHTVKLVDANSGRVEPQCKVVLILIF